MAEQELIEKIARELYEFGGRYGSHQGKSWAALGDITKEEYHQETKFLFELIKEGVR